MYTHTQLTYIYQSPFFITMYTCENVTVSSTHFINRINTYRYSLFAHVWIITIKDTQTQHTPLNTITTAYIHGISHIHGNRGILLKHACVYVCVCTLFVYNWRVVSPSGIEAAHKPTIPFMLFLGYTDIPAVSALFSSQKWIGIGEGAIDYDYNIIVIIITAAFVQPFPLALFNIFIGYVSGSFDFLGIAMCYL